MNLLKSNKFWAVFCLIATLYNFIVAVDLKDHQWRGWLHLWLAILMAYFFVHHIIRVKREI